MCPAFEPPTHPHPNPPRLFRYQSHTLRTMLRLEDHKLRAPLPGVEDLAQPSTDPFSNMASASSPYSPGASSSASASASGAVEDDGVGELNVSLDVRLRFLFYQLVRALNWCHQNGVSLGGAFSVSAYPAFAHPDQTPCATHMKLFRATHSYPRLLPM